MRKVFITGTGMALAAHEISNQNLCDMFPLLRTSDRWIKKNVGIEKRYMADENEQLKDFIIKASLEAIREAGVTKIDRIYLGCNTQPQNYPALASHVANGMKDEVDVSRCWCMDIQNGCPSGLAAIALGMEAVQNGSADVVLALGGDLTSRMVDWFDRNTCLLLGDAASAFILTTEEHVKDAGTSLALLSYSAITDHESADIMKMDSSLSDITPFEISRKTRKEARDTVRRITGHDTMPPELTEQQTAEIQAAGKELKRKTFPPDGKVRYTEVHDPYFIMDGAGVLERIRRIVPDCGYLDALRNAGVGLDLFEKYGLNEEVKVSQIPRPVRREFLNAIGERYTLLIPHQANLRGHQNISAAFRVPMKKIYSNIAQYANTSAAATGIAFYEALRQPSRYSTIRGEKVEIETPMLQAGDKAVLVSFGSGLNVVFIVVERLR